MTVIIDHHFNAPADQLWDILGTPDRVDWVPGVEHCALEGDVRSLTLPGAGDIKERILFHSHARRIIEYSCFEAPGVVRISIILPGVHATASHPRFKSVICD